MDRNQAEKTAVLIAMFVVVPAAVIVLLCWVLGEGVLGLLAHLLWWLGTLWPNSPKWGPCFAMGSVFTLQQLLTLPMRCFHDSINRRTGEAMPYNHVDVSSNVRYVVKLASPSINCMVLIFVLQVLGAGRVGWSDENVLIHVAGRLGVCGYLLLFALCYACLLALEKTYLFLRRNGLPWHCAPRANNR